MQTFRQALTCTMKLILCVAEETYDERKVLDDTRAIFRYASLIPYNCVFISLGAESMITKWYELTHFNDSDT